MYRYIYMCVYIYIACCDALKPDVGCYHSVFVGQLWVAWAQFEHSSGMVGLNACLTVARTVMYSIAVSVVQQSASLFFLCV